MGPPLHMHSVVDGNVITRHLPVFPIFWRTALPLPPGCSGSQRMAMWKERMHDAGVSDHGGEMTEWVVSQWWCPAQGHSVTAGVGVALGYIDEPKNVDGAADRTLSLKQAFETALHVLCDCY